LFAETRRIVTSLF